MSEITYFLCLRNLGDALVQEGILSKYFAEHKSDVLIFCTPSNKFIFERVGFKTMEIRGVLSMRLIFSPFKLILLLNNIRKFKGTFVSSFGDFFEIILLVLSGRNFYYPAWPLNHYINRILRVPKYRIGGIPVNITSHNLYDSFDQLYSKIYKLHFPQSRNAAPQISPEKSCERVATTKLVAFSPFGSVAAKQLSIKVINSVLVEFDKLGYSVVIFCSRQQVSLLDAFNSRFSNVQVSTSIEDCVKVLKQAVCYVGVDTFWAHYSVRFGLPVAVFSGGIPSNCIYPPDVYEISFGSDCLNYPCYNNIMCKRGEMNYLVCLGSNSESIIGAKLRGFLKTFCSVSTIKKLDFS